MLPLRSLITSESMYFTSSFALLISSGVSSTLAVSNIRNRTYTNYEVYLIGYGYGKFKEKIHFMEQYR